MYMLSVGLKRWQERSLSRMSSSRRPSLDRTDSGISVNMLGLLLLGHKGIVERHIIQENHDCTDLGLGVTRPFRIYALLNVRGKQFTKFLRRQFQHFF